MEILRYPAFLRLLHWAMAAVILGMIAVGWTMTEISGLGAPLRGDLYALHKSFGVVALALIALRVLVRLATRIPPLPEGIAPWEKTAAGIGHLALYAGMVAVPLSGFVMSMASGKGVAWFGLSLPNPLGIDKKLAGIAHELHEVLPYVLLAVIAAHIAGALKHRFFDRPENDVLPRMGLPLRKREQK